MMSLNSNKRKGRINSNSKVGRTKFYSDKNMSCDGVYGNSKLMYAASSLVGTVVNVQVQNGNIFEGVLRTFSHQLDVVLEAVHKVNPKGTPMKGISPTVSNLIASYPFEGGIYEKLVFKLSDVVMLQACNVDLDYAVKDNFTDTAISKFNGQIKERELEPWEGAGSDPETTPGLIEDDDGINGWDANDMFRTNAEKYGVKSSYDNSLQEYTVPLTKKDTEEYKLQEAKASKIAQEIETNSSYQSRIQLENGDEEDKFSAVVRPEDSIPTKYVLPQKRRNMPGLKRQQNSTSSPIHAAGSKGSYSSQHTSNSNIPNPGGSQYASSLPVLENQPQQMSAPFSNAASTTSTSASSTTVPLLPKNRTAVKTPDADNTADTEKPKLYTEPTNVESAPTMSGPTKMQVLCPPQSTLPPRIERRRENEKKFSKQKGRTDEIEEFKKFSSNFKLTEEKDANESEEAHPASDAKVEPQTALLANKLERTKIDNDDDRSAASSVVKYSTLNPNAKEFVFNPAKTFTPRSMAAPTSQPSLPMQPPPPPLPVPSQRMQQDQMMTLQASQMIPNLHQQLFAAMPPQYVMQASPVSMAITNAFAAATPVAQAPRFRKVPITMQHRHDITHVAAATGQPILAPAALPTPSQLTVQYTSPPGLLHASAPNQQGYPQMNFIVGPRVVSPQPVGVIPTSHSVSYCDTSHLPTHLIMSAHPGATHSTTPHTHLQQQQQQQQQQQAAQQQQQQQSHSNHHHHHHHPPQSQTPTLIHPSPSPVHQVPPPPHTHHHHGAGGHSQPPTPTAVMYPGAGGAAAALGQHPLQAAMGHHHPSQALNHHPMHHHPGFATGPQQVVLMQPQQQSMVPTSVHHHGGHSQVNQHHHHSIHHHHSHHPMHSFHPSQNHPGGPHHMLPQMTIIPTSAAITSAPTPPFVQHP